jgi:cysteine desulfurase / selenocysteine lyase
MTDAQVQGFRALFPILRDCVYFNSASTGPMPTTEVEAITGFAWRCSLEGEIPYREVEDVVEETRAMVAQLMHVSAEEIAFTRNTSQGIIIAIGSIDWRPGDNLIMMRDAFPADYYPFHYLLPDVEKRYVTSMELAQEPDCVFRLVDRRTRVVSLDWVHSMSGIRCDIEAIAEFCRPLGVRFIVDAIQGLGTIDTDFSKVRADFVCSSVAKWLLGPQGIGLMYVNRDTLPRLRPCNFGWLSARWEEFNDMFTPRTLKPGAARYEEGTKNYLSIYAMREGLKVLLRAGLPEIAGRIRALADQLRARLTHAGFRILTPEEPARSGGFIVCDRPGADMSGLHRRLTDARLICSLRENRLRIAPHFFNTNEEVSRFMEVLTG